MVVTRLTTEIMMVRREEVMGRTPWRRETLLYKTGESVIARSRISRGEVDNEKGRGMLLSYVLHHYAVDAA